MKTRFCCTPVDGWKRRFLRKISSRCWIPVNAHAPIKGGTVFIRYCVFVRTSKKYTKTRRVDAVFFWRRKNRFKKDGFVWTEPYFGRNAKSVQALERKHNISDWRLENLACAKKKYGPLLDLKRLKEKSISIHLFIFNSDTFACVGLEKTFQQSDQTDLVTSHIKYMKCSVLCEQGCASRTKSSVFSSRKYSDEN